MNRVLMEKGVPTAGAWALLSLALSAFNPVAAQEAADNSIPRMADGHPDLSGVWWGGGDVGSAAFFGRLRGGGGEEG